MQRTDKIIVIDLEATCWENNTIPEGSKMDIIEIGICNLYIQTGEIKDKRSIYVIPQQSELSAFCTELTGITKEIIQEKGITLTEACKVLEEEYDPKERVWASFGEFDRSFFQKQCLEYKIKYPMGMTHINIKYLFPFKMKFKKAKGLQKALLILKEPFEGKQHNGADDAYNAAKILRYILK